MGNEVKIEETDWTDLEELREYDRDWSYSEKQVIESYNEWKENIS